MRAGFDAWTATGCVELEYRGRIAAGPFEDPDGRNVVYLLHREWPAEDSVPSLPRLALSGNDIIEGDLAFNLVQFSWTLEGDAGLPAFDLQGSVAHEVGHLVGLTETTREGSTMNAALNGRESARSLAEDDIEGVCAVHATRLARLGEACIETDDCVAPLRCLEDEGDRYCSRTCADDARCGAGLQCHDGVCARASRGCSHLGGGWGLTWVLALGACGSRRLRRGRPRERGVPHPGHEDQLGG